MHSFVPHVPNLVSTCWMDGKLPQRTDGKWLLYLIAPFTHGLGQLAILAVLRVRRKFPPQT